MNLLHKAAVPASSTFSFAYRRRSRSRLYPILERQRPLIDNAHSVPLLWTERRQPKALTELSWSFGSPSFAIRVGIYPRKDLACQKCA